MTPLELFANPVTALLFDLFLKATVLLLLAVGLAIILRKSSAAVRHRVWSLTFAGLLLLPALSYVMPELQLPILPAEIIHAASTVEADNESPGVEAPAPESLAPQREQLLADESSGRTPPFDARTSNEFNSWELGPEGALQFETPHAGNAAAESVTSVADSSVIDIESTSPPTSAEAISVATVQTEPRSRTGSLWLWIWYAGLSVCALPILFGLLQNRVLSGVSPNVSDPQALALLDQLRAMLSIDRRVRLIESEHSRIPLTWGLFRPVILFPADWQTWSVERTRLVLLHELAHVKRCDVASQLVARVVCAVYWFHPLCWYALKRIKIESELSCDDCVLMTGESPQAYASELIGIARSARRMMFPAAVAMAQPSSLEQRIRALLDRARSRLPLGGRLAGVLFVASLLIVAGIAAVTPVVSEVAAETESSVEKEAPEVVAVEQTANGSSDNVVQVNDEKVENGDEEAEADEEEDKLSTFRGTVVDADGKPVAGASVKYLYSFVEYPPEKKWISRRGDLLTWPTVQLGIFDETTTDENGRYKLSRDWSSFKREREQRGTGGDVHSSMIVASATGDGEQPMTGWIRDSSNSNASNFGNPDTSIPLKPTQSGAIRGQLIDLEGRPIAGARVSVPLAVSAEPEAVDRWVSNVNRLTEKGVLPRDPNPSKLGIHDSPEMNSARFPTDEGLVTGLMVGMQPVVSDDQGRFEISNPGDDCLIVLRIESSGNGSVMANVVTRDIKRVEARQPLFHGGTKYHGKTPNDYHGLNCTIVVPPSQIIEGVVRDADTREPIPGIMVSVNGGKSVAETDEEGRYRLTDVAPGDAESMSLYPRLSLPYFCRESIKIPEGHGTEPIEFDLELKAGVWIEGRVVNRQTGAGLPDFRLRYAPYPDNPHARKYLLNTNGLQTINSLRFWTDEEGNYRLLAIPGRGIVGVMSNGNGIFRTGIGAEEIEGIESSRAFAPWIDFFNSMKAVEIPEGAKTTTADLEVDPGETVFLNVQNQNGQPLEEFKISGFWPHSVGPPRTDVQILQRSLQLEPAQAKIQGLAPEEIRPVLLLNAVQKIGLVIEINADAESGTEKSVKLQPLAGVIGRIVDGNGNPVEAAAVRFDLKRNDPGFGVSLEESSFTDSDGKLDFSGLIPGGTYSMVFLSDAFGVESLGEITPQPGETIDLGEIDITSDERPEPKRTPAKTTRSDNNTKTNGRITVRGRVVDPDGKPLAGATVRSGMPMYAMLEPLLPPGTQLPMSETKSDAAGRFEISFSRYPFGDLSMYDPRWQNIWIKTEIAASHPDYGPAWITYEKIAEEDEFTLKLVPDLPIRGRVVDLEGRPVTNVDISIGDYGEVSDGDLDAWIEGVKLGELPWTVWKHMPYTVKPRLIGIPYTYRTNASGQFEIRGVGKDRVVQCRYQGETVAYEKFRAVTREMEPIEKLINSPPNQASETVYGKDFTIVATLSRRVEGIVKDAETGQSLAGVDVHSYRFTGYPYANHRVLKTKTDENGRFRLTGFPKGDGNRLLVLPNDEQPYLMREVDLPNPTGAEPVEIEIELHRGIWITGRVTDKQTGRPQHARLYYFPFRDNEYVRALPEFDSNGNAEGDQMRYQTHPDGTFRLVGLPGRAIVGAWSVLKQYRTGVGAEQIEGIQENGTFSTFSVANNPGRLWPSNLVEIDPPADAESVDVHVELEFGGSVPVEIVDPDGLPVDGRKLRVDGHLNRGSWAEVDSSKLEVANLQRDETRTVIFHDEDRHLGWIEQIKYDENRNQPLTIRLQLDATITGRLVDGEGDAIAGASLRLDSYPGGDYSSSLSGFTTGKEGRFTIRVPAGADYYLLAEGIRNISYAEIAEKLQVEPGETIDMGEIDITSKERPKPKRTPAKTAQPTEKLPATEPVTVRGRVLDPDGKPLGGAHVAVIARSRHPRRGDDVFADGEILAEGTSAADGRFQMTLEGVSGQTHHTPMVIARKDGAAMAWSDWGQIDLNASLNETTLQLRPEEPIRGRLIDINGQPAAGARLLVWTLTKPTGDPSFPTNVAVFTVDIGADVPAAWIPPMTTDEQGRFTVHGVPAGFGAMINVNAGEQFAPQRIALNTGRPEQRDEEYDLYHWLVKNVEPGEEAVLALAPAQQFEGVVRFEDTREPAANARMTIWASQRQRATSTVSVAGQADAEGRYRITPNPGVAFGFIAYSPDGTPYLGRQTPSNDPIRWKSAGQKMQVDVDLPRGVLVKGRVLEAGTGTPVAGVAVQYVPEFDNNDNASDEVVTGPGSVRLSGDDGRFEIAVLPGPGRLLARSSDAKFILQTIGSRELSSGLPGGERRYAHAVSKIDPVADSEPFDVTLELQPGKSISGRIVNERGEPVDRTTLVTRLVIVPSTAFLVWRGDDSFTTRGGRFELTGLADGEEYPVYVLDPENRLGATATLSTKIPSPTIVLEPCGSAVARFVHPDGNPVADGLQFDLHMVVTPGTTRFDRAAIRNGELVADEQPVSKFDPVNYTAMPKTDEDGKITYPALIPGARYRFINYVDGNPQISSSFIAKSGETYDMGEIVVER